MGIAQRVLEKLQELPPEKQQEVLDFTEFLAQRVPEKAPRRDLYGLLADLGVHVTDEDIDEIRKEMWSNFPRDDF
jgi:hypothetical protein